MNTMISKFRVLLLALLSLITATVFGQTDRIFLYNDVYQIIENINIYGKLFEQEASVYKKNKIKKITSKTDKGIAADIYYINENGYLTERIYNYPGADSFPDRLIVTYDSLNRITHIRHIFSKGTFEYNTEFYYSNNSIERIYHKTSRDSAAGIYYPVYNNGLITGMKWGRNSEYNDLFLYDNQNRLISSQSNYGKEWVYHNTYEYIGDSVLIKAHDNNSDYRYISTYVIKNNFIVEFSEKNFNACYIRTDETEKQRKSSCLKYYYGANGLLSKVYNSHTGKTTPVLFDYEYYSE